MYSEKKLLQGSVVYARDFFFSVHLSSVLPLCAHRRFSSHFFYRFGGGLDCSAWHRTYVLPGFCFAFLLSCPALFAAYRHIYNNFFYGSVVDPQAKINPTNGGLSDNCIGFFFDFGNGFMGRRDAQECASICTDPFTPSEETSLCCEWALSTLSLAVVMIKAFSLHSRHWG